VQRPGEVNIVLGEFRREFPQSRPVADDDEGVRQRARDGAQEIHVLLGRDPANIEKDRPVGPAGETGAHPGVAPPWTEKVCIDAAPRDVNARHPPPTQLIRDRARRGKGDVRPIVDIEQASPHERRQETEPKMVGVAREIGLVVGGGGHAERAGRRRALSPQHKWAGKVYDVRAPLAEERPQTRAIGRHDHLWIG